MSASVDALALPRLDTVAEVLSRHAGEHGGEPALMHPGEPWDYAELRRRVLAFAGGLTELGIAPGGVVGLLCTNRPEWVVAALGAIVAGARVAAFNTWSRRWDLDHLLAASGCEVLVAVTRAGAVDLRPLYRELLPEAWRATTPGFVSGRYPALRELVLVGEDEGPAGARRFEAVAAGRPAEASAGPAALAGPQVAGPEAAASRPRARNHVALVLSTSGSTARPKAVPLTQGTALEHGWDVGVRMGVRAGDPMWLAVPLFWSYGGANALMVALTHGCPLVLQEVFEPGEALALIERHRCRVAYTLPNITAALLADPGFVPERLASLEKGMTIGSAADVVAAATGLGIAGVCNAYGSTEIYGCCTATPHDWPLERKRACQGPPLPRIEVTIRAPESGAALGSDEIGEITVAGQVTRGYLGADGNAAGAARFGPHGYRTGDLGRIDAGGNVVFVARATEMIKTGGINVAPAEVEEFLLTHPDVAAAAVTGTPDPARGEVVVGFVALRAGTGVGEPELRDFCRDGIAGFKVPVRIAVVPELPVTSTGKLARGEIRDRARELWPST